MKRRAVESYRKFYGHFSVQIWARYSSERGVISRGTYGKVKLYLDRVACLARRLLSIRTLSLNIVRKGLHTSQVAFQADTYLRFS